MWALSTCGAWPPNEIKKNTHPNNITSLCCVCGQAVLDWVMRKNLSEHPTSRLVTRPSELPARLLDGGSITDSDSTSGLPTRGSSSRHPTVAHVGKAHHSAQILSAVDGALHAGRCPQSGWDEILWTGLCGAGR